MYRIAEDKLARTYTVIRENTIAKSALSDANVTERSLVETTEIHCCLPQFIFRAFRASSDSSFYPRSELIHGEYRYSRCVVHLTPTYCLRTRVFCDETRRILLSLLILRCYRQIDSLRFRCNRVFVVSSN